MLWLYGYYKYFTLSVFRRQNLTSDRRQILTSKDGPRAERVNMLDVEEGVLLKSDVILRYKARLHWNQ